jgi:multiple sugar transport system substrate-binding protein
VEALEGEGMSTKLGLPALAAAVLLVVGCGSSSPTAAPTQPPTASAPAAVSAAPSASASAEAGSPAASATAAWQGVDDGTKLTMWTRAATQARAEPLVKAYNSSHKNQIALTVVPTNDYNTKVSSAAAAGGLPDLLSGDVVFMPNWTSAGLFQDLTAKIAALPFKDSLAQGAIQSSTWDNKQYGLPFVMDLSVWMYNKKLFTQAGLDPNKPPTTLAEFQADAAAINKLGGGVHGTFFGGDCGGCGVFTWWPIIWADGQQVMSPDGKTSLLNSDTAKGLYTAFAKMVSDGTALMPDSKTETGPTWTGYFPKGNIGIMPMPASLAGVANDKLADADIGVTPIAGIKGGQATFVGGDAIAVTKDSKSLDQAWNFIAWLEDEDAQVNVIAKPATQGGLGAVVSRTDLASNKYTSSDPRLVMFNSIAAKGVTPFAVNFNAAFNDPQSPWLVLYRDAIFNNADSAKIDADNNAITSVLSGS